MAGQIIPEPEIGDQAFVLHVTAFLRTEGEALHHQVCTDLAKQGPVVLFETAIEYPGFQYGVALAKTAGRASLRLADAPQLPFDFRTLYKTINGYAAEIITQLDQLRENTSLQNQLIRENQYNFAGDPTSPQLPPPVREEVPHLNFAPLLNALSTLDKVTGHLADTLSRVNLPEDRQNAVNVAFYKAEQQLLSETGLPRRPWYRHTIYAPGFYTGYGVKTLPGIREAIEQRNWKEAQEQIGIAAQVLTKFANYLGAIRI